MLFFNILQTWTSIQYEIPNHSKMCKNKKFEYIPIVHDWLKFNITFLVFLYCNISFFV